MDEQLIADLLQDIEEKVNSVHNAVQQISAARSTLEDDYNSILQRLKELEKKQDSTAAGHSRAITALREDTTKTSRVLEDTGARINNLTTTIMELEKRLVNIQAAVKGLAGNHAEINNRQQEIGRQLEAMGAETARQLEGIGGRVDMLHHTLAKLERRGEQLAGNAGKSEARIQELSREVKSLQDNCLNNLSRRLENLEEDIITTSHTLKGLADNDARINNNQQEITIQLDIHRDRLDKLERALAALEKEQSLAPSQLEQKVEAAVAAALETPKRQILQVFEIVKRHHRQLQLLLDKNSHV